MKTFEELKISEKINLQEIENFRVKKLKVAEQQTRNSLNLAVATIIAIIICIIFFHASLRKDNFLLLLLFFLPFVLYRSIYVKDYQKVYENKYRREVLIQIIHLIAENIQYSPTKKMKKSYFEESNFIVTYDLLKSKDYIEGTINTTNFVCSDVEILSKGSKSEETLFQGLFCAIEFKFPENLILDILPDKVSHFGKLGTLFQKMNIERESLVKIENSSFEEEFVVYSNAPNLARSIITADFQRILSVFTTQNRFPIFISIRHGKLFFGMDTRKELFPISLSESLLKNTTIEKQYRQFSTYFDFIIEVSKLVESKTSSIVNLSTYELL